MKEVQDAAVETGNRVANDSSSHLRLVDMHCHLDRMENCPDVAGEAAEREVAIFCTTVTPYDALRAEELFACCDNVRVGIGLHPWLVGSAAQGSDADPERLIEHAATMAAQNDYIGEIGLDLSSAHAHNATAQVAAFERIARSCAEHPRSERVISLHAVRSADKALDVLERYDLPRQAACIFHWFSGTADDLARLRRLGCYISVNERMLATRRGREYARQMPAERLLLETDAPEQLDTPYTAVKIEASLAHALHKLAIIRGTDEHELGCLILRTSSQLINL